MAKKIAERTRKKRDRPTLEVNPRAVREGDGIIVRGGGWPDCPVKIEIGDKAVRPFRIAQGLPVPGGVRPDARGDFVVLMSTLRIKPGRHRIVAASTHRTRKARITEAFEVSERPRPDPNRREAKEAELELYYWRALDFFNRRFGHIGFVPPGTRTTQVSEIRRLRAQRDAMKLQGAIPEPGIPGVQYSISRPAVCNWTPVGAGPVLKGQTQGIAQPVSGRTKAIVIDPRTPSTVYIGTANGGVWKSTDGGTTWSPKTDFEVSLAIGALAIDPNNSLRIFAGTGEYGGGTGSADGGYLYYGNGLLRSEDGGETWTPLATSTFEHDEISRILFDPTDPTSQRMFLSSTTGVYESTDGGINWGQLRAGSASGLVLIVNAGPPQTVKLIAAFHSEGLRTRTRTGSTWSAWTEITGTVFPAIFQRIALGQCRDIPQTIYAAFSVGGGIAMAKTTDGGQSWSSVTQPLRDRINVAFANNHSHLLVIPEADFRQPVVGHIYTVFEAGTPTHTHNITFTTAEMQNLVASGNVSKTTDPDVSGHQHSLMADFRMSLQTGYNLHISVHPTDPNIVYYGEVFLWKTTTGDGPWTYIMQTVPPGGVSATGIHPDQHAFAFDPTNPDIVWACNDGGVFRSENAGQGWNHRNRDLATLQYMSIAVHPRWEAIMLGGTQDNGTHRYSGNPAWELVDYGDGSFTAIDPNTPTRMYHGQPLYGFYRSDSAGAQGTWVYKSGGVQGGGSFIAPFILDPIDPNVCYFGDNQLRRSPDNADTWSPITNLPNKEITAIAVPPQGPMTPVQPQESTTIYVGTNRGQVYRVQKTGPTWALPDVTTTDLTGPSLPANAGISDIAVDTIGTVWVTLSSIVFTPGAGQPSEFSYEHVYRRVPWGTTWESRSNGLARANPINTIVINSGNDNRLFCGGDMGVFRTEDAGATWVPWDEGLPNAPVFDLAIFNPSPLLWYTTAGPAVIHGSRRLLRAATFGRSVWERPIDVTLCPRVDLYLRDHILDTGRLVPMPAGQAHPFNPATNVYWWQSPDIKIDAPDPNFQTPAPITDYMAFEELQHRNPRRGAVNRFYVQVHNRGPRKATNVQVRAFFADAFGGAPSLPADFWSGGNPFMGTPSSTDWTPIGPTQTIPELEPAEPGVVEWDWLVPPSAAAQFYSLLAVATCAEDPVDVTGRFADPSFMLNVAVAVPWSKYVALKSIFIGDPVFGSSLHLRAEEAFILELHNPYHDIEAFDLAFHWGSLPEETRIFVAFEHHPDNKPSVTGKLQELKRLGIQVARGKTKLFLEEQEDRCGEIRQFDLQRVYQLSPSKDRTTTIPSVRVPHGRPLTLAINLVLPTNGGQETAQFDVIQQSGKQVVGGATYLLRLRKAAKKRK